MWDKSCPMSHACDPLSWTATQEPTALLFLFLYTRKQILKLAMEALVPLSPSRLSFQASMACPPPLPLRPSSPLLSAHRSLGLLHQNSTSRFLGAGPHDLCSRFAYPPLPIRQFNCKSPLCVQAASTTRSPSQPRFIQHKLEAFWFYRFLSIVYDHIINPGHWTVDMREEALEPADLNDPDLIVVDVGGGTGFCTQGIVKHVNPKNVTILDQSPHQLAKAREKEDLKECTIIEGDAEDLPFSTDSVDRYISAGSIEYWPDPQRGIREAYRVLKRGGKACLIGPVHPTFWLSSFFADMWMLFPTEEEYMEWFTNAGFVEVRIKRIGPKWYRGVRRHGLIMGCSVTGVKPHWGDSPLQLGPKAEDVKEANFNPIVFLYRFLIGVMASIYYVLVPIYMWLKDQIVPKGQPI